MKAKPLCKIRKGKPETKGYMALLTGHGGCRDCGPTVEGGGAPWKREDPHNQGRRLRLIEKDTNKKMPTKHQYFIVSPSGFL